MLVYATVGDLTPEWVNTAPADAARLIRYASILVGRETMLALYDTDASGMPTETVVLNAFRAATCAQVAAWMGAGIDPAAGPAGQSSEVAAESVGGDSVTYVTTGAAERVSAAVAELAPAARDLLALAGLLANPPRLL